MTCEQKITNAQIIFERMINLTPTPLGINASLNNKKYLKEIQVEREKGGRFEIRMKIFDFSLFENHIC